MLLLNHPVEETLIEDYRKDVLWYSGNKNYGKHELRRDVLQVIKAAALTYGSCLGQIFLTFERTQVR